MCIYLSISKQITNSHHYLRNLDLFKLKAPAGNKINVAQTLKFYKGIEENIVGKRQNAGYHLSLCHHVFNPLYIDTHFNALTTDSV